MNDNNIWMKIRAIIVSMEKPFCILNLFIRLEKEGITDQKLILCVLDELYEEGVVVYTEVDGIIDDPQAPKWAYKVA